MSHAEALGLGAEIEIEHVCPDPRDPYHELHGPSPEQCTQPQRRVLEAALLSAERRAAVERQ